MYSIFRTELNGKGEHVRENKQINKRGGIPSEPSSRQLSSFGCVPVSRVCSVAGGEDLSARMTRSWAGWSATRVGFVRPSCLKCRWSLLGELDKIVLGVSQEVKVEDLSWAGAD